MTERLRDYYPPLTSSEDVAAIKAEEARRIAAYGDLPDIGPEHFDCLEDYEEWVMEGSLRFCVG